MLPPSQIQRKISEAYIRAIVAKAGYDITVPGEFDSGEDFEIIPVVQKENRGKLGKRLKPLLIQLKSSYDYETDKENNCIKYDLEVKNYNQLIESDRYIPFILVLYCMPKTYDEWLSVSAEGTMLKYCGYWTWLSGEPMSNSSSTHRIFIPQERIFNEESLKEIIKRGQMEDYNLYAPA
jgi:hypothetical protein